MRDPIIPGSEVTAPILDSIQALLTVYNGGGKWEEEAHFSISMAPNKDSKKKQTEAGQLVVTAQQSRFHVDASDTSTSKEVNRFAQLNIYLD